MFQIGQRTSLGPESLVVVVSGTAMAGLTGSLIAGWISSRVGMRVAILVGLVVFAVPAFLITHSANRMVFGLGSALCAASTFFLLPLLLGAAATLDQGGALGELVGAAFIFGNSVAPAIGGYGLEVGGIQALGWACVIGSTLAGALMIYLLRGEEGLSRG